MPLQLRPALPSDTEACGVITEHAFSTNVLINHISGGTTTSVDAKQFNIHFWTQVIASSFQDANCHLDIVEDISLSPPIVVGLAKWVFVPENSPLPGLVPLEMELSKEVMQNMTDPELGVTFFGDQHARHEKYMGSKSHCYLALIATRPDYRGFGAGRMLMESGVQKVDEEGYKAYLEASPEGKPLFEKFGFRVEQVAEYLDGRYLECSMIRDTKKTE
ncbi:hypothetical protein QBC36DRAFT_303947 [Triangularia setosa]|uniref:N-acetyltransferase domain-containing protein n=1 Tax=Triangularia setosa TaxID=2587417 RepID=A0AAN6W2J3_9PEZI|nr:hypothetical protein QBC36DRAFT_303947 [Podospora setosa]